MGEQLTKLNLDCVETRRTHRIVSERSRYHGSRELECHSTREHFCTKEHHSTNARKNMQIFYSAPSTSAERPIIIHTHGTDETRHFSLFGGLVSVLLPPRQQPHTRAGVPRVAAKPPGLYLDLQDIPGARIFTTLQRAFLRNSQRTADGALSLLAEDVSAQLQVGRC